MRSACADAFSSGASATSSAHSLPVLLLPTARSTAAPPLVELSATGGVPPELAIGAGWESRIRTGSNHREQLGDVSDWRRDCCNDALTLSVPDGTHSQQGLVLPVTWPSHSPQLALKVGTTQVSSSHWRRGISDSNTITLSHPEVAAGLCGEARSPLSQVSQRLADWFGHCPTIGTTQPGVGSDRGESSYGESSNQVHSNSYQDRHPASTYTRSTFAKNRMNDLIGRLRADVGELRSQGTSLAKQIWLLYVTFEDFMHIHHPDRSNKLLNTALSDDAHWYSSTGHLAGYPSTPNNLGATCKKSETDLLPSHEPEQEVEVRLTSDPVQTQESGDMDKLVSGFSKMSCLGETDLDEALSLQHVIKGALSCDATYDGDMTSPGTTSSGYDTDQDYMTWQETRMRQGKLFMAAMHDARSKRTLVRATSRHAQSPSARTNGAQEEMYVIRADDLYHENYTSSSDNDSATYWRGRRCVGTSGKEQNASPLGQSRSGHVGVAQRDASKGQPELATPIHNASWSARKRVSTNSERHSSMRARRGSVEKSRISEVKKTMQDIICDLGVDSEEDDNDSYIKTLDMSLMAPRSGEGDDSLERIEGEALTLEPVTHGVCMFSTRTLQHQGDVDAPPPPPNYRTQADTPRSCNYPEEMHPHPHRRSHDCVEDNGCKSPQTNDSPHQRRGSERQPHWRLPEHSTPRGTGESPMGGGVHSTPPATCRGLFFKHEAAPPHDQTVNRWAGGFRRQDVTEGNTTTNTTSTTTTSYHPCSSGSISSDSGMASFATEEYSMEYDCYGGSWSAPPQGYKPKVAAQEINQEENIYETIPDELVCSDTMWSRPIAKACPQQRNSWAPQSDGKWAGVAPTCDALRHSSMPHPRRPSVDSIMTNNTYATIDTDLVTEHDPPPPLLPARTYRRNLDRGASGVRHLAGQGVHHQERWSRGAGRSHRDKPPHLDDIVKASDILSDTPGNHMYTVNDVLQSFERLAGDLPAEEHPEALNRTGINRLAVDKKQGTPPPKRPHACPTEAQQPCRRPRGRSLVVQVLGSSTGGSPVPKGVGSGKCHSNPEPWYLQPCPALTGPVPSSGDFLMRGGQCGFNSAIKSPQQQKQWSAQREKILSMPGTYC